MKFHDSLEKEFQEACRQNDEYFAQEERKKRIGEDGCCDVCGAYLSYGGQLIIIDEHTSYYEYEKCSDFLCDFKVYHPDAAPIELEEVEEKPKRNGYKTILYNIFGSFAIGSVFAGIISLEMGNIGLGMLFALIFLGCSMPIVVGD